MQKKEKPRYNTAQNTAWMIRLAWTEREKKVLILSALTALIAVANSTLSLYVTPVLLNQIENGVSIRTLAGTILAFTGGLLLLAAAGVYVNQNNLFGRVQVRTGIISMANSKAATTSYPNTEDEKFRKLAARTNEACGANSEATEAVWTTLTELLKNVLGFAVYVLLLSGLDGWLLLTILVTASAGFFITRKLNDYEFVHREEIATASGQLWYSNRTAGNLDAAKDIRLFSLRPWLQELSRKAEKAYLAFYQKANGRYFWGRVADLALTFLRNGIAYAYLIALVLRRGLSASDFLLYFSAAGGFAEWITGILGQLNTLRQQSLDISVVREYLEYPEPFQMEGGLPLPPQDEGKYEIRLENVSFSYPGSDRKILENIDLTLHPGEKLAVVGLNGAGKTTLIKLLCGFLDPTEGRVLLNGQDVRAFNRRDYYRLFSAVFQDFVVLPGSVAMNVAQNDENVDLPRVRECAEQAGLLEKINSLPNGFDTFLNREIYEDAVALSGGETQRLMLARALYKNAPIILLDEPTAALDPIAEADLYQKYSGMTAGKSSVYISHRLASTRFCDRILFIENGKIAEEGSHETLLAANGRYAELFNVQSRYYAEGGDADETEE